MNGPMTSTGRTTIIFEGGREPIRLVVSTDHSHDEPRGEVYVEVAGDGEDLMKAMTPEEAVEWAHSILAVAAYARTKPAATHNRWGQPL